MPSQRHVLAIGGAILGNLVDGYGVVAVAFIGKAIESVWNLDPAMLGLVFASGPAGMMLGSFIISPFADKFGRRKVSLAALLLVALGMFGAAAATNVLQLIAMLIMTGLGVGGVLATLNTLVAEIAPPARRNTTIAIFSAGYPLGSMIAGGLAIGLMATYGWQIVFISGGLLALVAFLVNLATLVEPSDTHHIRPVSLIGKPAKAHLFGDGYRANTILICLIFFLNMLSFYFVLLWTARLTIATGLPEEAGATAMTIVNGASLIGPFFFGLLADRLGLIRMASFYFLGFAAAIALFATASGMGAIYGASALVGLMMAGAMTSLYASTPLLFPADVRATGTGIAIGIGRLGATVGPMLAGFALQIGVGRPELYGLFTLPPLLVAVILMTGRLNPSTTLQPKAA